MKHHFSNINIELNWANYEVSFYYAPEQKQNLTAEEIPASVEIYKLEAVEGVEADIDWEDLSEAAQGLIERDALKYAQNFPVDFQN